MVPWWGDRSQVTLGQLLIHMVNETARHAGHADIVRELIDGSVGHREGVDNLGEGDEASYAALYRHLEDIAAAFKPSA